MWFTSGPRYNRDNWYCRPLLRDIILVSRPLLTVNRIVFLLFPRCVKVGPDTANPTAATKNTVCTSTRPFKLHVHSDSVEFGNPAADGEGTLANNRGFSIGKKIQYSIAIQLFLSFTAYWQKSACLTVKSSWLLFFSCDISIFTASWWIKYVVDSKLFPVVLAITCMCECDC